MGPTYKVTGGTGARAVLLYSNRNKQPAIDYANGYTESGEWGGHSVVQVSDANGKTVWQTDDEGILVDEL